MAREVRIAPIDGLSYVAGPIDEALLNVTVPGFFQHTLHQHPEREAAVFCDRGDARTAAGVCGRGGCPDVHAALCGRGGHAAVVACDHLEETMPPLETVGTQYLVTAPLISATNTKGQFVRVIATAANTTISYDPP